MSLPMYPYTNMSDTNLDWVISTVKKLEQELADVQKKLYEIVSGRLMEDIARSESEQKYLNSLK